MSKVIEFQNNYWNFLLKPTNDCNFNCKYCYDEPMRRKNLGKRMTIEQVEHIMNLASKFSKGLQVIYHGGEPTLMGVEWYKKVQDIYYKHFHNKFHQSMQSNGYLLNREWLDLVLTYGIELGISFDVYDQNLRQTDTLKRVEENIKLFNSNGAAIGTITVINSFNYKNQIDLYEYFKKNFTFSPAFNHIYHSKGALDNALEPDIEDFAKEYRKYLEYWIKDTDIRSPFERSIREHLFILFGKGELTCTHSDCRYCWLGINADGSVYPCDRYVPEKYYCGNIFEVNSIFDLYNSAGHKLYSSEVGKRYLTHCSHCGYLEYCGGLCNANHIAYAGSADTVDPFSCGIFKTRFRDMYDVIRNIDIYNNKYNINLISYLVENFLYTPKEILDFLKTKGFDIDSITKDYSYDYKKLLYTKEFKLFKIFNQTNKTLIERNHTNFISPTGIDLSKIDFSNFDINTIKEARFKFLDELFNTYETVIKGVIS